MSDKKQKKNYPIGVDKDTYEAIDKLAKLHKRSKANFLKFIIQEYYIDFVKMIKPLKKDN